MPLPEEGPCGAWCTWDQVVGRCLNDADAAKLDEIDEAIRDELIAEVSEVLYLLDGARMPGTCTATRQICRSCACGLASCCCRDRSRDLDLGDNWPAARVTEVTIDGEVLDPASYEVDHWRWVRRTDGESWPLCGDRAPVVTWEYGREVTAGAQRSAVIMVLELAKACVGIKCQLPERITSVQREGVTYTIIDSMKMLDDGRTGFYYVDLWLAARKRGRKSRPGGVDPAACSTRTALGTDADAS